MRTPYSRKMITVKKRELLAEEVRRLKSQNLQIGFVPTMGALHHGHESLINEARKSCDVVVLSVFVNPTQFNTPSDYTTYPATLDADLQCAERAGVDLFFMPDVEEMYQGELEVDAVDFGTLTHSFEGRHRQGHFDGVVAIVRKLFDAVKMDCAFFGEKDLQQLAVIKRLARDEFPGVQIIGCPLIRDTDGLALSSRNVRLSKDDRTRALKLNAWIHELKEGIEAGSSIEETLESVLTSAQQAQSLELEYLDIVNPETFEPRRSGGEKNEAFAVIAAAVNGVRLIDNCRILCS